MAIAQVSNAVTNQTSAATSAVMNLPASLVSGNLIVIAFICSEQKDFTAAGWTFVEQNLDASTGTKGFMYKVSDGTEGSTVTVNYTAGSASMSGVAVQLSGVDTEDPTNSDNVAYASVGSSLSTWNVPADTLTSMTAGNGLLMMAGCEAGRTVTSLDSDLEAVNAHTALAAVNLSIDLAVTGTGNPQYDYTWSDSRDYDYALLEIVAAAEDSADVTGTGAVSLPAVTASGSGGSDVFEVISTAVTSQTATGTTAQLSLPSGLVAGNLIIIGFICSEQKDVSATGWTVVEQNLGGSTGSKGFMYKVSEGDEGSTVTASYASGTANMAAVAVQFAGVDTDDPTNSDNVAYGSSGNEATWSIVSGALTGIATGNAVLVLAGCEAGRTVTSLDSDLTEVAANTSLPAIHLSYDDNPGASTQQYDYVWNDTRDYDYALIEISKSAEPVGVTGTGTIIVPMISTAGAGTAPILTPDVYPVGDPVGVEVSAVLTADGSGTSGIPSEGISGSGSVTAPAITASGAGTAVTAVTGTGAIIVPMILLDAIGGINGVFPTVVRGSDNRGRRLFGTMRRR